MARSADGPPATERLAAAARREALLDAARELVQDGGADALSMSSLADRAGVTRALIYKHFPDRTAVLAALYRREATRLDSEMRAEVLAAPEGFEPRLRAFVRVAQRTMNSKAAFFVPLRSYGVDDAQRRRRRTWDRRTLAYFTELAAEEYAIPAATAEAALVTLLPGILTLVTHDPRRRTAAGRAALEDLSADIALGALERLSARSAGTAPRTG